MARHFIQNDTVTGDVDEERPAMGELVIHVHDGMNNEVDRRRQMSGDGQFAHEALAGLLPGFMLIGKPLGVDDDEEIIIGAVAALAVLDPIPARIGAEEDQLEDSALPVLVGEPGLLRIFEFIEDDAGDPFQLAALVVRQMGEAVGERHEAPLLLASSSSSSETFRALAILAITWVVGLAVPSRMRR